MTKPSETIVFFGSGPVATESLRFLHEHFEIEAVFTKPLPPHHRDTMPTIDFCESNNIPVYTASAKAELTNVFNGSNVTSRLGIVIDFGVIIERSVIDGFPLGILNSHFSLLPELRGADPITFSILSGQQHTGVSLMSIDEGMDTGPIMAQEKIEIKNDDTVETLTQKLIDLSNSMLQRAIPLLWSGQAKFTQQTGEPSYSRKLTKEDRIINWNKPAEELEREVRAFHAWPKSVGKIGQTELIIRSVSVVKQNNTPGTFEATKDSLVVFCGRDALRIISVQPPGKKEMPIQAFLAGNRLE